MSRAWFWRLYLAFLVIVGVTIFTWIRDSAATEKQAPSVSQSSAASSAVAGSSNAQNGLSVEERTTAIAVGTTAPIPIAPADCWFPAKGFKRGHSVAWGLWQASAVLERDEQCIADQAAIRAHEIRMAELALATLRAQSERDLAAAERIRAESELVEVSSK